MVKTKSQKVLGSNSYVCRSYRGKAGRWGLFAPPLLSILNRVKRWFISKSNYTSQYFEIQVYQKDQQFEMEITKTMNKVVYIDVTKSSLKNTSFFEN